MSFPLEQMKLSVIRLCLDFKCVWSIECEHTVVLISILN